MALFFDAQWFDAQLAARGLTRRVLAAAAGMSEADLALAYKDQRELSADEVGIFAEILGVSPAEIARQAGISTPIPGAGPEARIAALEQRVTALEAELARLKGQAGEN
ncbi:DNA-binding protein [Phenylobacterium sp.]|uniref:DNA-binding protein n=1 Tax=Phenylobacterium sp. TaxID=1871053 RepID=UPI000C98E5C7|nr:DNA-binding protein [Phenylobacterium sp.]MAK83001.1 DNA-binding protein [Phenylobacterium sp.]